MKRIKSNYHAIKLLKSSQPKLRKAIISNCNRELFNCISECILNVLKANLKVSESAKQKLRKHKSLFLKVADNRVTPSAKNRLINQRGGYLLPLHSPVLHNLANLLFRKRAM